MYNYLLRLTVGNIDGSIIAEVSTRLSMEFFYSIKIGCKYTPVDQHFIFTLVLDYHLATFHAGVNHILNSTCKDFNAELKFIFGAKSKLKYRVAWASSAAPLHSRLRCTKGGR